MTRKEYETYVRPEQYAGKHFKKYYNVWRVVGPAGPEEQFSVEGLDKAAEAVYGMWDAEVTDMSGRVISPYVVLAHYRKAVTV